MNGSSPSTKTKAADLLFRAQMLARPQYERVIALGQKSPERSEEVILENDIMSEADLLKALSAVYRTHFVSTEKLAKADIPRATVQLIPRRVAETMGVFPVLFDRQRSVLSVVTADPDDAATLREIKLVSGASDVKAFVTRPAAIAAAIRKHHAGDPRAFELLERGGLHYDFGQQVMADGRIMTAKDTLRNTGIELGSGNGPAAVPYESISPPPPAAAPPVQAAAPIPTPVRSPPPTPQQPASPPPLPRRSVVAEEEVFGPRPARNAPPSQFPAVEQTRAPKRTGRSVSLSAPPPPNLAPSVPAPGPVRSRAPHSSPPIRAAQPARNPAPSSTSEIYLQPSDAVRQQILQNDTTIELLTVMVSLLENSRAELRGHSSQVARLLRRVAERMNLDRTETHAVIVAGHIHDIGKMGQFHLTALNCAEYEGHRVAAQKTHETPLRLLETVRLSPSTKNAVMHMYERFDGKGFPGKLVGKDIPLGGRLLAVADTYADLTQNPRNPFRKVLSAAEAMDVLAKHRGSIFDPSILDLFKALVLGEDMKEKLLANRYRALIVDADPEESTVLELRMVEQGFDVRTARSVEAARKLLAEGVEFGIVICEVELPDADGLAFLSEARREAWGRDIPWVVHTQKTGRAEAQRAFDLGAMDFVSKPVQADVLVAKLKAMLENQKNSSKRATKGVSGSLREMGLPDIVQVLFHGRKTGKLNVNSGGKAGEIHFLEGNIANALLGDLAGTNAFYAMLKFVDGDFALDPSFTPPKRIIEEPAEALLLEGMRRMDEGL